jgi:hypothetical protein
MRIRDPESGSGDPGWKNSDPGPGINNPDPQHWWNDGISYYSCLPVRACWRVTQWASVGVNSAPSSPPSTPSTGSSGHPASTSILGTVPMPGKFKIKEVLFHRNFVPYSSTFIKNFTARPLESDGFSFVAYFYVYGCVLCSAFGMHVPEFGKC